jgi:magnesium-transporting ATPase (P-type)
VAHHIPAFLAAAAHSVAVVAAEEADNGCLSSGNRLDYHLEIVWIIIGAIIFLIGACMVGFAKPIADNLAIASYSRLKMWGIIFCVLGLLILPSFLPWLLDSFFTWLFANRLNIKT